MRRVEVCVGVQFVIFLVGSRQVKEIPTEGVEMVI